MKNKDIDVSNKTILEAIISLQEQVSSIQNDMATKMATKDFVKMTVEESTEGLVAEIRAIGRAVDKDALTIISHERRITHIERQMV
jgi:hypothetical protein